MPGVIMVVIVACNRCLWVWIILGPVKKKIARNQPVTAVIDITGPVPFLKTAGNQA
jgi:hypothetical protein